MKPWAHSLLLTEKQADEVKKLSKDLQSSVQSLKQQVADLEAHQLADQKTAEEATEMLTDNHRISQESVRALTQQVSDLQAQRHDPCDKNVVLTAHHC